MKINKVGGGNIAAVLTKEELGWFRQTLNECCNGFGVKDFKATIGVEEAVLLRLLAQFRPMYRAPIGHEG